MIYNNLLQNSFHDITRDELQLNFWNNSSKIERFANGILSYFNEKNKRVSIEISHYNEKPRCIKKGQKTDNVIELFEIKIPFVNSLLGYSEEYKKKFNLLSSIFLKHELAHVIFSNFSTKENEYTDLIEDARVEYHYSNVLKGNKRNFLTLNYFFYKQEKKKIEEDFSFLNLAKYIKYSIAGIRFWDKTSQSIKVYDEIYKKYIDMLLSDNYLKAYEEIFSESFSCNEETEIKSIINANFFKNGSNERFDNDDSIAEEGLEFQPKAKTSAEKYKMIEDYESIEDYEGELFEEDLEDLIFLDNTISELNKDLLKQKNEINEIYDSFCKNVVSKKNDPNLFELNIHPNDVNDSMQINFLNFFSYFTGFGFNQKKGLLFYNQVVAGNKKVINESVRFLKLKLQNKERIKFKRFLKEGEIDQENIHNLLIEKEEPRIFQRKIQQINPKSSIHVLMDISGSMGSTQLKMCIINTIILYEICKKVGIKFSFQMFTTIPSISFKARKRKNPITLRNILHLFKNQENDIYVTFSGERFSTLLSECIHSKECLKKPVDNIRFNSYIKKGIIFYMKNIEEAPSFIFERALGILIDKCSSLRKLGGGTPEFECFAQTIKLHNNDKNKNKMLFLINDGNYDSSFASGINFTKDNYFFQIEERDDISINEIVEDKILSATTYLNYIKNDLIEIADKNYHISVTEKIISELYKIRSDNSYLNNFDYNMIFNSRRYILTEDQNFKNNIHLTYHNSTLIYRSFINNLRKRGWKIFGGGIKSSYGVRYIGKENFAIFEDETDIKKNFSKKLRNYF